MHQMAKTHSSGGSRVGARPPSPARPPLTPSPATPPPSPATPLPLPRPLSEVLDTPLHSPYLHLEALKEQNSLSDNYNPAPPPPNSPL